MNPNENIFEGHSVPKTIMKFALPTILSQMVTLLYNLADTFFVGRTNNPSQIAALTLSFPIFMSLTMVGNLFGIGANSYISRSLGQGERNRASKASTFSFYGAIAGVILIITVLFTFMSPILQAIGARTPETFDATKSYITWTVIYGGIPTVATLMLGHLIRSEGHTKEASIGMALGGILNIFLDLIFVQFMSLGAKGAAIATCLSNIIAFFYLFSRIRKNQASIIELNPKKISFELTMIKDIVLVGIPAAVLIILGSAANITLTSFMSHYGDVSIAAFGIVQKIGTIAIQITIGLTQGIMPLLGYSYGANNMQRVKEINRWSFGILGIYALSCVILIELFAQQLIMLFTSEPATVAKATEFIRFWIICAPGMCFTNLFSSVFQAMGKWVQSLLLSLIRQLIMLIPLLIILSQTIGEMGLVYSQPISDTVAFIAGIILYLILIKKQDKKSLYTN